MLIPFSKETVFVKYLTPDFINFVMIFCKDMDFDDLLDLAKDAHEDPRQFERKVKAAKHQARLTTKSQLMGFEMGTFGENDLDYGSDDEGDKIDSKQIQLTATFGDKDFRMTKPKNPFQNTLDDGAPPPDTNAEPCPAFF